MPPDPFFHLSSREVRFYVSIDDESVGASIGEATLHHCFSPTARDDVPLETFAAHIAEIEAAVRRRVSGGSFKPVMLREHDLRG